MPTKREMAGRARLSFPTEREIKSLSQYILRKRDKDVRSLRRAALAWQTVAADNKLDWDISWLGVPIIANPYDMVLMQELIFRIKPDLIVESGIAHGGSLIYYASTLELLNHGAVIGIDIDIRKHNRVIIEKHPLIKRVSLIEGSSTDPKVIDIVKKRAASARKVLVLLDSNHNHNHVLNELVAYSKIVNRGGYVVVFDTIIHYLPEKYSLGRPWSSKHNPKTAVDAFLKNNHDFVIDREYNKFFVSSCPNGFLRRI